MRVFLGALVLFAAVLINHADDFKEGIRKLKERRRAQTFDAAHAGFQQCQPTSLNDISDYKIVWFMFAPRMKVLNN